MFLAFFSFLIFSCQFQAEPVARNSRDDCKKYSAHKKQSRMSQGLLEDLIRETVEASLGPVVSFIWHGGEPTLAGIEFYEKAVRLQKEYLPEGWQVWNNL